jgi:hypothetical protein
MHYDPQAFSNNGLPTIVVKKNQSASIGQRNGMSPIDVLEVQRYYGCAAIGSSSSFLTLPLMTIVFFMLISLLTL